MTLVTSCRFIDRKKATLHAMPAVSGTAAVATEKEARQPLTVNPGSLTLLEELDQRQDEVLAALDALNLRIEQVLKECAPAVSVLSDAA